MPEERKRTYTGSGSGLRSAGGEATGTEQATHRALTAICDVIVFFFYSLSVN
jgi:hypothetical protein